MSDNAEDNAGRIQPVKGPRPSGAAPEPRASSALSGIPSDVWRPGKIQPLSGEVEAEAEAEVEAAEPQKPEFRERIRPIKPPRPSGAAPEPRASSALSGIPSDVWRPGKIQPLSGEVEAEAEVEAAEPQKPEFRERIRPIKPPRPSGAGPTGFER